jgi:hypothetical protein
MANQTLTLESLGDLNMGTARVIVNEEIKRAVLDTEDRGGDEKPRKVVIEVIMTRREDGLIETEIAAQAKLPPRRAASTTCKPVHRGKNDVNLVFESWSPENPDQAAFPEMDKE